MIFKFPYILRISENQSNIIIDDYREKQKKINKFIFRTLLLNKFCN